MREQTLPNHKSQTAQRSKAERECCGWVNRWIEEKTLCMPARTCERRCRKKKRIVYFMKTLRKFKILAFLGGSSLGRVGMPVS
jgi:hypothetical protein